MISVILEMVYYCDYKKPIQILENSQNANAMATNIEMLNKEIQRSRLIKNTFAVPNITPQMQTYSSSNPTKNQNNTSSKIITTNEMS